MRCFQLAAEYRQRFHKDVVIDVVCYRRMGHNEMDQPMFTQPVLYTTIKQHPSTFDLYSKQLLAEGVVDAKALQAMQDTMRAALNKAFENAKSHVPKG